MWHNYIDLDVCALSDHRDQREPRASGSLPKAERDRGAHKKLDQDHLLSRSVSCGPGLLLGQRKKPSQISLDQTDMSSPSDQSLYTASTRAGSTSTASTQTLVEAEKRSSISRAMDKIRSKVTGSERLSSDISESEKAKAKEIEKQKRKEDMAFLGPVTPLALRKSARPESPGWRKAVAVLLLSSDEASKRQQFAVKECRRLERSECPKASKGSNELSGPGCSPFAAFLELSRCRSAASLMSLTRDWFVVCTDRVSTAGGLTMEWSGLSLEYLALNYP
ncbi:uncharacterized protein MYCFIDRAFT_169295 [Pseudocercospora fijiensis CIRAD86]|uniref:Uncharacterized protein n=1 Tax=Pseudocercospora fijiensis (strain CIRAD86) TaxID=383855 RepID=N1Q9B2_PSEFD|nr:uncharacterized protein MYCFIDRAFT_169295 [Pseudocercospora fijiensis CIRAD86]EME87478.1 hypothetical protein MYCFIDRAFT_169295 [Pseudocercospora fijiensis CIRAD86]